MQTATENEIIRVVESSDLEAQTSQTLKERFLPFFEQAEDWKRKAESIVVTSAEQKHEMQIARQARLALREIRINADKTRKALKEDSLRYGRAVQGVYNVIEYLIAPIEEHLEKQERFVEIQEAEKKAKLKAEREIELHPYSEFVPCNLDLGGMTEVEYEKVLNGAKLQLQARIEEQARIEAERIAKEKAEAEERARIHAENERLRAEAEEREKQIRAEREKAEAERKALEEKAEAERRERIRLEAEAAAKAEAERREKAEEAARIRAEEAARQAAPDIEKAKVFAAQISALVAPEMSTKQGREKVERAMALLQQAVSLLK